MVEPECLSNPFPFPSPSPPSPSFSLPLHRNVKRCPITTVLPQTKVIIYPPCERTSASHLSISCGLPIQQTIDCHLQFAMPISSSPMPHPQRARAAKFDWKSVQLRDQFPAQAFARRSAAHGWAGLSDASLCLCLSTRSRRTIWLSARSTSPDLRGTLHLHVESGEEHKDASAWARACAGAARTRALLGKA